MGCACRLAGRAIRTKGHQIEGLTDQRCVARDKSQREIRYAGNGSSNKRGPASQPRREIFRFLKQPLHTCSAGPLIS